MIEEKRRVSGPLQPLLPLCSTLFSTPYSKYATLSILLSATLGTLLYAPLRVSMLLYLPHATLCYTTRHYTMPLYATLHYTMLLYATLCMLLYATPSTLLYTTPQGAHTLAE